MVLRRYEGWFEEFTKTEAKVRSLNLLESQLIRLLVLQLLIPEGEWLLMSIVVEKILYKIPINKFTCLQRASQVKPFSLSIMFIENP